MSDSEDLQADREKIEAYDQLRHRAGKLGYPSVNHALDDLEELSGPKRNLGHSSWQTNAD